MITFTEGGSMMIDENLVLFRHGWDRHQMVGTLELVDFGSSTCTIRDIKAPHTLYSSLTAEVFQVRELVISAWYDGNSSRWRAVGTTADGTVIYRGPLRETIEAADADAERAKKGDVVL